MPSSFVVGTQKILDGTEPRFVVLAGNEYELKKKLLDAFRSRDTEFAVVSDPESVSLDCFLASYRPSKEKIIFLECGDTVESWDWLPIWFNKVKRTKLVVLVGKDEIAAALERRANSRGLVINCVPPTGAGGQMKLAKMIAGWYNQSQAQVNLLLVKNNWRISPCLQLLDKLKLLNLSLTSETILRLGLVFDPAEEFLAALAESNSSLAMSIIPKLDPDSYFGILQRLSSWLDRLARIKLAYVPMKAVNEIANEVGESRQEVERLQKQGRKFTLERINKLSLAIAGADRELAAGYRSGVLELLASKWD